MSCVLITVALGSDSRVILDSFLPFVALLIFAFLSPLFKLILNDGSGRVNLFQRAHASLMTLGCLYFMCVKRCSGLKIILLTVRICIFCPEIQLPVTFQSWQKSSRLFSVLYPSIFPLYLAEFILVQIQSK